MHDFKRFNVLFISNNGSKRQIIGSFDKKQAIIMCLKIAILIKYSDKQEICSTSYVDIEEVL